MRQTTDFAVIGAGIAGASAAYELSRHGSVAILEMEQTPGHHTTGRSAALYTEAYESGPVRLLVLASRRHLEAPPDGFADRPLLSPLATLFIARPDQLSTLDAIEDDVAGIVPVERLDARQTLHLCPQLRPDYVAGGLIETNSMEIDVHGLHQGFLRGARRRGAEVTTGTAVNRIAAGTAGVTVHTTRGAVSAGHVINAAGAWCDHVAMMAGARPKGLQPYRRTALTFDVPSGVDISGWPMVVDADEQFYFKPERTQFMGSLAEETPMPPHDVHPEEIDVALAIKRINTATTFAIRHVRSTWAGLRTFAPDRRPVVGADPDVERLFWLAGQGGYGIMTSPAMADLTASLITASPLPSELQAVGFDPATVSPRRFAP